MVRFILKGKSYLVRESYKSESNQCLTIKHQRQSSWFLFNIQMLILTLIKVKQGMVISVVVMNVIVLFCLPIRTTYDNGVILKT